MSVFNIVKMCLLAGALLCNSSYAIAKQDLKDAVEYFTNELEFTIGPDHVKRAMEAKASGGSDSKKYDEFIIVDLRSAADYNVSHIPGAINVPYDKYSGFDEKNNKFDGLQKGKYHYIYTYDAICDLADKAGRQFADNGYAVKKLKGGFNAWSRVRNFPVNNK